MKPVRIGIMTTLWKRPELTRIVLSYYASLKVEGVEFTLLVAGSEGRASRALAKECGWYYVSVPNAPLGAKHNRALKAICKFDIDCVVVIGSDDLCNVKYFERVRDDYRDDIEALSMDGVYYHNRETGETVYVDKVNTGAGRMLSLGLCRRRSFKGWPDEINSMLDGAMSTPMLKWARPKPHYINNPDIAGIVVVDIKGAGTQMWSHAQMTDITKHKRRTILNTKNFFDDHFPGVLGKLKAIKQTQYNGK